MTLAIGFATVPPIAIPATAQAATHQANLTEACKQQYHNANRATPCGYYCVETILSRSLGIPSGAEAQVVEQEVGDLNVQIYCDKNYPGSKARGNFDADKTWDCVIDN
ncbi:hypothetical protein [Nocardia sp. NPDC058705]|uniref:hypothetical protein n=1 Tax=Nocardia sp. NPDC058705 TaxID=3346609 RepID=UPI003690E5A8